MYESSVKSTATNPILAQLFNTLMILQNIKYSIGM